MEQPLQFIANLALAMMLTALAAVELRSLKLAAYAYLAQALLMVSILLAVAYATQSEWLLVWALVALITKAGLISWLLLSYIRRLGVGREAPPFVDFAPSLLIAAALMVGCYKLTHAQALVLSPIGAPIVEPYRTNLAVAFTLFALGLYGIITRRDAFKAVIGMCLLENGVHLSLVSLAPGMPEMPIIGLVTEVFISVWMLLHVIAGVQREYGGTDTAQLRVLRG